MPIDIDEFIENMQRPQLDRLPNETPYVNLVLDITLQVLEKATDQKVNVIKYSKQ